ncbi:MAG: lyase family protein, partial [Arenibacterium sp.]
FLMTASLFDSALFAPLFDTGAAGRLFSDTAEIRAMMLVEGALARVQAAHGVIPETSAAAISRAAMEIQIDPGALAGATATNGVSVPAFVAAFRAEMGAPEHAQYLHWGATSQDIMDTGLMLRLRQLLVLIEQNLGQTIRRLAQLAENHAALPMPARTYGQVATPTSFGAVVAGWGLPLVNLLQELPELRRQCLLVSLSGAAGTASQLGADAALLRVELAKALDLNDPGRSWHVDRTPLLRIADWLNRIALALGKMGEDGVALAQSGISEIRFEGAGGSSTMPQKQNPVGASVLIALAHHSNGLCSSLRAGALPQHQRDGASWFTEWLCLPQIGLCAAAATERATKLSAEITPVPSVMLGNIDNGLGLIYAEALSFALSVQLPRPEAQATLKKLCREAEETQTPLAALAQRDFPDLDMASVFDPKQQMGTAVTDAHAFVEAARALSEAT